jgi:hypothetical protein
MAVAKVQYASGTSGSSPVSAVYGSTPTLDNLLVAVAMNNVTSGTLGISGWTMLTDRSFGTANSIAAFAKIAGSSESTNVSCTSSGAPTQMRLAVWEFSGSVTTSASDAVYLSSTAAGTFGATATTNSASFTTGSEAEYALAAIAFQNTVTAPAADSGFTIDTTYDRLVTAYKAISSSGSESTTFTWTTSRNNAHVILGIKAYVAPGPTTGGTLSLMGVG